MTVSSYRSGNSGKFIPFATNVNDGVMSSAQAAKLANLPDEVYYTPVNDHDTTALLSLVASEYVGRKRKIVVGPGRFHADVNGDFAPYPGTSLEFRGTDIVSTLPNTVGGPAYYVLGGVSTYLPTETTVTVAPVVGAYTITVADVSVLNLTHVGASDGQRICLLCGSCAASYRVVNVVGNVLTLDSPIVRAWDIVLPSVVRVLRIVTAPEHVHIFGVGASISGTTGRYFEWVNAIDCSYSGFQILHTGSEGVSCSFDHGCVRCHADSIRSYGDHATSLFGFLFESSRDCYYQDCSCEDADISWLYLSTENCSLRNCSSYRTSIADVELGSEVATVGWAYPINPQIYSFHSYNAVMNAILITGATQGAIVDGLNWTSLGVCALVVYSAGGTHAGHVNATNLSGLGGLVCEINTGIVNLSNVSVSKMASGAFLVCRGIGVMTVCNATMSEDGIGSGPYRGIYVHDSGAVTLNNVVINFGSTAVDRRGVMTLGSGVVDFGSGAIIGGAVGVETYTTSIVRVDWRRVRFSSTNLYSDPSGGGINRGTVTVNGITPVSIAYRGMRTSDSPVFSPTAIGGASYGMLFASVSPGVGFSVASVAGNTVKYDWTV